MCGELSREKQLDFPSCNRFRPHTSAPEVSRGHLPPGLGSQRLAAAAARARRGRGAEPVSVLRVLLPALAAAFPLGTTPRDRESVYSYLGLNVVQVMEER